MEQKPYQTSAIVPAYNEEKKISTILSTLTQCPELTEIICINDGSTDATLKEIQKFPQIKLINLPVNHGKGYAIVEGIKAAQGDIVVFIDADLVGFKHEHVCQLIEPLLDDQYTISIGYPSYYQADKFFKPITGERAYFKKDLLPHLDQLKQKGYAMELFLNYTFRDRKMYIFAMNHVANTLKHHKQSLDFATKILLIELADMFGTIFKHEHPFSFLYNAYLYPFYLSAPQSKDPYTKKLKDYLRLKTHL